MNFQLKDVAELISFRRLVRSFDCVPWADVKKSSTSPLRIQSKVMCASTCSSRSILFPQEAVAMFETISLDTPIVRLK